MKFLKYTLSLIACLAIHNAYSLDISTGREFAAGKALQLAQEAYKKAKAPRPMIRFASNEEALKYYHKHENEIKRLADDAISMAITDRELAYAKKQNAERENNKSAIRSAQQEIREATRAIKIANEAIEAAIVKHTLE